VSEDGSGESGARSCFSLIVFTIFSRSIEVMCFSLRLRLSDDSCRPPCGRLEDGHRRVDISSTSEEEVESRLEESSGTSCGEASFRLRSKAKPGDGVRSGAQQNVSREYILQLRFSNRLPSAIESAHLLNTVEGIVSIL
jgi:hypothetical protein